MTDKRNDWKFWTAACLASVLIALIAVQAIVGYDVVPIVALLAMYAFVGAMAWVFTKTRGGIAIAGAVHVLVGSLLLLVFVALLIWLGISAFNSMPWWAVVIIVLLLISLSRN